MAEVFLLLEKCVHDQLSCRVRIFTKIMREVSIRVCYVVVFSFFVNLRLCAS